MNASKQESLADKFFGSKENAEKVTETLSGEPKKELFCSFKWAQCSKEKCALYRKRKDYEACSFLSIAEDLEGLTKAVWTLIEKDTRSNPY